MIMNVKNFASKKVQAVKSFFQKKILPTLKYSSAEEEVGLSTLSLILTCISTQIQIIGYGCIYFDCMMLGRAMVQGQLKTWQSAISVLSIVLTVAGLLSTNPVAFWLGLASVLLDVIMLIYAIGVKLCLVWQQSKC